MSELRLTTLIDAPLAVCFDLIRDRRVQPDLVVRDSSKVNGLGRTFTFSNPVLGYRSRMKVLVIEYHRPRRFVDLMIDGYFHSFFHIHQFDDVDAATRLTDTLIWEPPSGMIGKALDILILKRQLTKTVMQRNESLRKIAESRDV